MRGEKGIFTPINVADEGARIRVFPSNPLRELGAEPRPTEFIHSFRGYFGPFSQRVVEAAQATDPNTARFIQSNLQVFEDLDITCAILEARELGYKERKKVFADLTKQDKRWKTAVTRLEFSSEESDEHALRSFTHATSSLLDIALDGNNTSGFRRYVLSDFNAVASNLLQPWGYAFNRYNPQGLLERLQKLFPTVPEDERSFLLPYIKLTSAKAYADIAFQLDLSIVTREREKAKVVTSFLEAVHEQRDTAHVPGESAAVRHWTRAYLGDEIDEQELQKVAKTFTELRQAFYALPSGPRRAIAFMRDQLPVADGSLVHSYVIDDLLQVLDIYQDGEVIVNLVANNLPPLRRLRTAIREDQSLLEPLLRYGKDTYFLYGIRGDGFWWPLVVRDLQTFWLEEFAGERNVEMLAAVPDYLQLIFRAEQQLSEEKPTAANAFSNIFKKLYTDPSAFKNREALERLFSLRIFPTEKVLEYLANRKEGGLQEIERLKVETKRGRFDPNNELQKDLEYLDYIMLASDKATYNYTSFTNLVVLSEVGEPSLNTRERMEAKAAAYEAANFYWFVYGRANMRRKVVVIGNRSFGADFIVDPLRPYLEDINVQVNTYDYVHSMGGFTPDRHRITQRYLDHEQPDDIIIVDGTKSSFYNSVPRLPSSMVSYYQWFSGESGDIPNDRYAIRYWVPSPVDTINIGNARSVRYVPASHESPQVILANPVITPDKFPDLPEGLKDHSPGYFDDPFGTSLTSKPVLTSHGVQKIMEGRTREQFIVLAQDEIERELPDMIRRANPLSRDF